MATDIGVRIGVEGEQDFKSALKGITAESKELASEMKALTAQYKNNAESAEATEKKTEVLRKQVENADQKVKLLTGKYEEQSQRLDELGQALEDAKDNYGENSEEAQKAQLDYDRFAVSVSNTKTQLNNAQRDFYNATNALEDIQDPAEDASDSLDDVGDSAEEASDNSSMFADVLKANLLSQAIIDGIKGLAELFKNIASSIGSAFGDTVQWADDLATLSTNTGISTKNLQAFEYMAGLTDTSVETITGSLRRLTSNMGNVQKGSKKSSEAFEKLGVSVSNEDGTLRNSYDVFLDIIDALGQMEDGTERDAMAMDVLGKGAQELNSLIKAGREGIYSYTQEAETMGYILSDDMLSSLLDVSDAQDRLNNSLDSIKRNGSAFFAPFVADIAENVMPKVVELTSAIGDVFAGNKTFDEFVDELNISFERNKDGIVNTAVGVAEGFATAFKNAPALIRTATETITSIAEAFKDEAAVKDLADALGECISAVAVMIGEISGPITELAVSFATEFAYAVGSHLPEILLSALKGVFGIGAGILDGILGDGSNIFIPEEVTREAGTDAIFAYAAGVEDGSGLYLTPAVETTTETVSEPMEELAESGYEWGADMTNGIAEGIEQNTKRVSRAVDALAYSIYGQLHFSRPDYGVLSDYETWMPDMVKGLSDSLNASLPMMDNAVAGLANNIAYGVQGMGANVVNITVTQPTEAWTEYLFDKFNVRLGMA